MTVSRNRRSGRAAFRHEISSVLKCDSGSRFRKMAAPRRPGTASVSMAIMTFLDLQDMPALQTAYTTSLRSIDELLERDKQREKDGFPRKIRVGRLVKPGKGGKDKVVVVPTTVEEKFIHDHCVQGIRRGCHRLAVPEKAKKERSSANSRFGPKTGRRRRAGRGRRRAS